MQLPIKTFLVSFSIFLFAPHILANVQSSNASINAKDYIGPTVTNLYFYRVGLEKNMAAITQEPPSKTFNVIKEFNSRDLNYIGYHLLSKGDKRAIPVLIEFMNPSFKKQNKEDANYNFTWTLLQMITGDQFVITANKEKSSNLEQQWFQQYKDWWDKEAEDFKLTAEDSTLVSIFENVKSNEDRAYRRGW